VTETVAILHTCLALGGVWLLWNYGWRQYQLDSLRQGLFALRDELFDIVADKKIPLEFGSPAYEQLRDYFNKALRFCHTLSFGKIFLAILLSHLPFWDGMVDFRSYKAAEEVEIEALQDSELKEKLKQFKRRAALLHLHFLAMTSPIFFFFSLAAMVGVIVALTPMILRHGVSKLVRSAKALRFLKKTLEQGAEKRFDTQLRVIRVEAESCARLNPA
jgi:hypothetical protein